ncbi:anaerobic ribonucleoside-triphosphate reductase [Pumilibacter intestinalis]|jgi:hypothetical protein|uniref:anaerobic ribonucleoside-triphosphate reductase n=1 Tax=Pumilibacter intestinalis TaxID=2941511 RepID=UPI002041497C|nr:anaerobic ribonucleoside-triphosphate reductase [Pumilibacter intestinalis]MCI8487212.1 hypothetical protein [Clostridia bacterium]
MEIIKNGDVNEAEEAAVLEMLGEKHAGEDIYKVELTPNGEYVDVKYYTHKRPFERIRRITGYLVGTLDRFNNAKAAEERERVKHGLAR